MPESEWSDRGLPTSSEPDALMPTAVPSCQNIFRLECQHPSDSKNKVEPNPIARIIRALLQGSGPEGLEFYLNDVIIGKNDPLKEERINDIGT
jgi:hypothetical protein